MKQKSGTRDQKYILGLNEKGCHSEIVAAAHLVNLGFWVFSPVVHQQGPIDLVAVNKKGKVILVDVKTQNERINTGRKKPARIYRIKTPLQKKLNVIFAYVNQNNEVHFVPDQVKEEIT
tara:strand:- start:286 stop:642 length:357 start_codon:yes stop_codon:yes gene_type:complete